MFHHSATRKFLISFVFLFVATLQCNLTANAHQRPVSIVGCYSDLTLDAKEGVVTGTGSFRIKKMNGKYAAFFTELVGDGGEYLPTVRIRNLKVNEKTRMIVFDITLNDGNESIVLHHVSGRISRAGIKMNWRNHATFIGSENPFLRRHYRSCT